MMTIYHDKGNPAAKQGDNAVSLLELVMLAKRPGRLSVAEGDGVVPTSTSNSMTANDTNPTSQHLLARKFTAALPLLFAL
ncbi:MAG: hypothetical protein M3Q91_05230 [Acidobacteriota bacterium]|nr:hypothetical protein [Acidobacteriota bacterium]